MRDPEREAVRGTDGLVRSAVLGYIAMAVLLTGVVALAIHLPGAPTTTHFTGNTHFTGSSVLGGWCRFDCGWYVSIAERGYFFVPVHRLPLQQSSVAFFPGYPLMVRPVANLLGSTPLAAIVITWMAGLLAVALFASWCAARLDRRTARIAVACLVLYPYGWFLFGAGYADALFLAAALGAFLLLEHDHPVLAGLVGAFATATRPIGLAVLAGLFLRVIERRGGLPTRPPVAPGAPTTAGSIATRVGVPARINVRVMRRGDLGVLLAPGGLIAFSAYLWARFGDPFAFSTAQAAWDQAEGPRTWFKLVFGYQILHGADAGYRSGLLIQALVTLIALAAVPLVARRFGAAYGAYTLLAVALGAIATKDFQGMGRYMLAAFPLFALAGSLLAVHTRRVQLTVFVVAAALLAVGAFGFARNWYLA